MTTGFNEYGIMWS